MVVGHIPHKTQEPKHDSDPKYPVGFLVDEVKNGSFGGEVRAKEGTVDDVEYDTYDGN